MGKAKTPAAPDPIKTSQAQATANIDTARVQQRLNMIDQYTPYGSVRYTPASQFYGKTGGQTSTPTIYGAPSTAPTFSDNERSSMQNDINIARQNGNENRALLLERQLAGQPATQQSSANNGQYTTPYDFSNPYQDRYVSEVVLPEDAQKGVEAEMKFERLLNELGVAQTGRVSQALEQPFSYDGLPAAPTADTAARQMYQKQVLDFYDSRNNAQFDRMREQARTRLVNQGVPEGSEAYNRTMAQLEQQIGDQRLAAQTAALQASGAEMERGYSLQANQRDRAIQELVQKRQLPLNEAIALISGTQTNVPQFSAPPATSVNAPNVEGNTWNAYNAQVQAANAKNAQTTGLVSGLAGLGLSFINPAAGLGMGAGSTAINPASGFGSSIRWFGR
jgi:hypothetical protein